MAMAKLVATRSESRAPTGQAVPPSPTFATNRLAIFWHTAIGKKVVMAVTGIVFVAFVIVHMLGNLKILAGPAVINI